MRYLVCLSFLLLAACSTLPDTSPAPAGYYRVRPGDTLYRIALNHHQSVNALVAWNKLADPSSITAGQLLRVSPASTAPAKTTPPATTVKTTPPPSHSPGCTWHQPAMAHSWCPAWQVQRQQQQGHRYCRQGGRPGTGGSQRYGGLCRQGHPCLR
nr:LysM domain-containing protein [Aquitalea pelogenes]